MINADLPPEGVGARGAGHRIHPDSAMARKPRKHSSAVLHARICARIAPRRRHVQIDVATIALRVVVPEMRPVSES